MKKAGYHGTQQDLRNENTAKIDDILVAFEADAMSAPDKELAIMADILKRAMREYLQQIRNTEKVQ